MSNDYFSWPDGDSSETNQSGDDLSQVKDYQQSINNSYYQDDNGFTFHAVGVILLLALIFYCVTNPSYGFFAICLAINVLLHELGHYTAGKAFGCVMREVSVFFIPAVTFKANGRSSLNPSLNTWRDTKWTLGVLPFGGVTLFMNTTMPLSGDRRHSPFLNHKTAGQRLLIHSAGVLVNLLSFIVCSIALSFIPATGMLAFFVEELKMIAFVLTVINVLPFHPLDGSSVLITIYEMVTGHAPSEQFMTIFKIVGGVLIFCLFFLAPEIINSLIGMLMPR